MIRDLIHMYVYVTFLQKRLIYKVQEDRLRIKLVKQTLTKVAFTLIYKVKLKLMYLIIILKI